MDHGTGRHESNRRETNVRSFDLQYLYRANPKAFVAAGALIGVCFVALLAKGLAGTSSGHAQLAAHTRPAATTTRAMTTTAQAGGVTTPNPDYHPTYQSVPQTPVLQKIEEKMGGMSPQDAASAEAIAPPVAAWSNDYPAVPASVRSDGTSYATAFAEELLDQNYRTQSRADLLRWAQAESAAELIPGIPSAIGAKALYIDLTDASLGDLPSSPVPSAAVWNLNEQRGIQQKVEGVFAHPDAGWEELVSEGFQSDDPLLTLFDLTGTLVTTDHGRSTTQPFTMVLGVGSALHHPGFGAFSIAQWQVS